MTPETHLGATRDRIDVLLMGRAPAAPYQALRPLDPNAAAEFRARHLASAETRPKGAIRATSGLASPVPAPAPALLGFAADAPEMTS